MTRLSNQRIFNVCKSVQRKHVNIGCSEEATGLTIGDAWLDSQQEQSLCLLLAASRPALALTQPPISDHRAQYPGEDNNLLPFSAEIKNAWRYTFIFPHVFVVLQQRTNANARCLCLSRARFVHLFMATFSAVSWPTQPRRFLHQHPEVKICRSRIVLALSYGRETLFLIPKED